ncbi:MAG TPA: hypothetical protein VF062_22710 [Candidatus Limnocylindrales bacterium]
MLPIGIRFHAARFTLGATLLSIGSGAVSLQPRLLIPSAILFVAGLIVTMASVFVIRRRAVIVHDRWNHHRIHRAMERAPSDAVVRIQQTWFPEEDFIMKLQDLLHGEKRFDLRILLLDPARDEEGQAGLVAARVLLRGLKVVSAVDEVRTTIAGLIRMKESVDKHHRGRVAAGGKPPVVDLEVRLYSFMPFGPIYQIAEDVMFVGLFLNYATSAEGPMLEVRNTGSGNRLWRILEHHFDEGWSAPTSQIVYPPSQQG